MSGLLPDKVLNIFLHNPALKRDGFKMWGRILKNYDPRGKDELFERVSALYTLKQGPDESIADYISHARRLFSRIHGITFNTMANLFVIVNSDRSHSGALANRFRSGNTEVVNADVYGIKTLLEVI